MRLIELSGFHTQLEALVTNLLGHVDTNMFWSADGSRSVAAWFERKTGRDRKECSLMVRTARDLRNMPETVTRFSSGELSTV